jgi:hypothetical protein
MVEKSTEWLILISVVAAAALAYLLAWRGKPTILRRAGAIVGAGVCALAALIATTGYGIPALQDLASGAGTSKDALTSTILVWIVCLAAWLAAFRFCFFVFKKPPQRSA